MGINYNIFLKTQNLANGNTFAVAVATNRTMQKAHKYKLIVVKQTKVMAYYTLWKTLQKCTFWLKEKLKKFYKADTAVIFSAVCNF